MATTLPVPYQGKPVGKPLWLRGRSRPWMRNPRSNRSQEDGTSPSEEQGPRQRRQRTTQTQDHAGSLSGRIIFVLVVVGLLILAGPLGIVLMSQGSDGRQQSSEVEDEHSVVPNQTIYFGWHDYTAPPKGERPLVVMVGQNASCFKSSLRDVVSIENVGFGGPNFRHRVESLTNEAVGISIFISQSATEARQECS